MRIQRSGDCNNSPKNILLEELTVALLGGDAARATALTAPSVRWRVPGATAVEGQAALAQMVKRSKSTATSTLTIHHVVSHGRAGAVTVSLRPGRGPAAELCLFFTFANAKGTSVDSIVTYRAD